MSVLFLEESDCVLISTVLYKCFLDLFRPRYTFLVLLRLDLRYLTPIDSRENISQAQSCDSSWEPWVRITGLSEIILEQSNQVLSFSKSNDRQPHTLAKQVVVQVVCHGLVHGVVGLRFVFIALNYIALWNLIPATFIRMVPVVVIIVGDLVLDCSTEKVVVDILVLAEAWRQAVLIFVKHLAHEWITAPELLPVVLF